VTFRHWLQEMWYAHLDEMATFGQSVPKYTMQEYFARYKYWLKREYRHQQGVKSGS
jgi:uncharacterized protein CbrC (UPF0167 family)